MVPARLKDDPDRDIFFLLEFGRVDHQDGISSPTAVTVVTSRDRYLPSLVETSVYEVGEALRRGRFHAFSRRNP